MKKIFKNSLLTFVIGLIIAGSIGVYASIKIQADEIGYKDGTVEDALNNLYTNANGKKFCVLLSEQYGTKGNIGSKYACNLGDGVIRNFFILKVDGNDVKMIMERNLSDTVGSARMSSHSAALNYLKSGGQGYSTVSAWTNATNVDLPDAQDIVDASLEINPKEDWSFDISTASSTWWCFGSHVQDEPSGPTYCPTSTAQQKASWLFDYTIDCGSRGCSNSMPDNTSYAYGYWTKDLVANDSSRAWCVNTSGNLGSISVSNAGRGVRPVITIFKSNLSN